MARDRRRGATDGPMSNDNVLDLIERFRPAKKLDEGHAALHAALESYGLAHLAYAAVNLPRARRGPLVAATYSPEWQKHYLDHDYINVDPIVQAGMGGILPIDWSAFDRSDPTIARFFGEAETFKIGPEGLSIPIRGRHGEFALFNVTSGVPGREWRAIKKLHARDFMVLAYYFHSWALNAEGEELAEVAPKLSVREKDCLRWRASGKSDWEISQILSISERTVKFHLESARAKLGATNTLHAVAKAMSRGLVVI
jgi:DNA-binding CsgD family transcriptional regulator